MVKFIAYVNGRLIPEDRAVISILDRGFTLADGLFETMTAINENVRYLDRHLDRLVHGCGVMGFELPPRSDVIAILEETLKANQFSLSTIRITVSRGYDYKRGLSVHEKLVPSIIVRVAERVNSFGGEVSLMISDVRRNEGSPLSNLKTLAYADSVFARKVANGLGYDDALMLNNKNRVVCATSSNFFLVRDGLILTPPLSDGALPGIVRSLILCENFSGGINICEKSITPDFNNVDAAFITNVVTGVTNVSHIDGRFIGSDEGLKIVGQLADRYHDDTLDQP
jgi:branched-chain amino acid aminotransferase